MIIEARGLSKRFGEMTAVDRASFAVAAGEIVGFVGANGAGKTTTMSMLLGFIRPTSGTVAVFDEPVTPTHTAGPHRRVGYAAGDMALPRSLTARQYLDFVATQFGSVSTERRQMLYERFEPQLDKKMGTLSRGNHQKIALVAAFLPEPDLVVLDEPTSGLDPVMQEAFLDLVRQEQRRGATIFMSSHYLNEVADVCTRVLLMRRGLLIKDVPAAELLGQSGKQVRVVSRQPKLAAPRGAEAVELTKRHDGATELSFNWKQPAAKLQPWLAAIKQLEDIEVSEFNLEDAFKDLYAEDE